MCAGNARACAWLFSLTMRQFPDDCDLKPQGRPPGSIFDRRKLRLLRAHAEAGYAQQTLGALLGRSQRCQDRTLACLALPIENSDGQQRLAAQQRREIGNCLDDCARLEAELFGHFGGAALNPECVQSSGGGAVDVPGIR